jgi:hypothetical protein
MSYINFKVINSSYDFALQEPSKTSCPHSLFYIFCGRVHQHGRLPISPAYYSNHAHNVLDVVGVTEIISFLLLHFRKVELARRFDYRRGGKYHHCICPCLDKRARAEMPSFWRCPSIF